MAYSDYGGYAYRNGSRILGRSDAVLSLDGIRSTPGQWPGWTIAAARNGGSFHALLGDGPIFVGLHKQSGLSVHRWSDKIDLVSVARPPVHISEYTHDGKIHGYIDDDHYKASEEPCIFDINGAVITVFWRIYDNHYQFVRLEQPDGNIWHGWSGYGVGAGLENAGYGYSTAKCERWLRDLWPDSIKDTPDAL